MTKPVSEMDLEEFMRSRDEQNVPLGKQIQAILSKPAARKRLRLHELVCQGCDEIIVEVLDTKPDPVMRWRESTSAEQRDRPADWFKDPGRYRRPDIGRAGEWKFSPLPDPLPIPEQSRTEVIHTACSCRRMTLPAEVVYGALQSGIRKQTHPRVTLS